MTMNGKLVNGGSTLIRVRQIFGRVFFRVVLRAKLSSHNFPNYRSYHCLAKSLNSQLGVITFLDYADASAACRVYNIPVL